jgi:hypothetical protein
MGSGKTSWAINKMKELDDTNYIYITPYLTEVDRVKEDVTNRKFYEPTIRNSKGSKLQGFKDLISQDKDIASTHALFSSVDEEVYGLLKSSKYTLILDEVMNVIEIKTISTKDFSMLLETNTLKVDENSKKVIWIDDSYNGNFDDLKLLSQNDNLYIHSRSSGDNKITLLVWTFPTKILECFEEIYILTYLFDGQIQRYYYDMYNIQYTYKSVRLVDGIYQLVNYIDNFDEDRTQIKKLINIYEGKLNIIGEKDYSLSSTWLKNPKNKELLTKLKNNTSNYFKHIIKSKSKDNMWTTLLGETNKDKSSAKVKTLLSGEGYTKGFVACNCRATNDYVNKISCAYLLNRFLNPLDRGFFEDKGVRINEELWSLSELIQWIWRSRIRISEPINLYLPSKRMRNLLLQYLNNEI